MAMCLPCANIVSTQIIWKSSLTVEVGCEWFTSHILMLIVKADTVEGPLMIMYENMLLV